MVKLSGNIKLRFILGVTTALIGSAQARNGFIPHYTGLEGIVAGAGTAVPFDASSTIANPAVLTRLPTHLMGTFGFMGLHQKINTRNAMIGNPIGVQKNGYKTVPIGTLGINYLFKDPRWAAGITVTGGGGYVKFKESVLNRNILVPPGSNYNKETVNRVMLSATTLSYRPSPCQSYGISLLVSSSTFKSDLAIAPGFTEVTGRLKNDTVFGVGTRIGGLWDLGEYFSLGASAATPVYSSRHDKYKQLFIHKFQIPATARLGGVIHFDDCTDLIFDLKYLFYGKSKWVHEGQKWRTQQIFLIGFTHKLTSEIMFGIGYNYAKSPIKKKDVIYNALSIPLDEHHISSGLRYNWSKCLEVYGMGYFIPEKNMTDNGLNVPPAAGMELKNKGYGAELGFIYKF